MSTGGTGIAPGARVTIDPPPAPHWHALTPHIKHVIIAIVAGVVVWLVVFKFTSVWAEVTKARQTQADAALKTAQDQLKAQAADRAAAEARYQQTVSQVLASNAALARQVADRDAALRQSQATLQNATPADVLARLQTASGLGSADASSAPNGLLLSDSGARRVTGQLEAEVVEKADLVDTRGQLLGVQSELTGANAVIDSLKKESAGKDTVILKADEACDAKVSALNAKHAKHNLIYSTVSFIAGVVLGRRL